MSAIDSYYKFSFVVVSGVPNTFAIIEDEIAFFAFGIVLNWKYLLPRHQHYFMNQREQNCNEE